MKHLSLSITVDEDSSPAYWVDMAIALSKITTDLLKRPADLIDISWEIRGTDDTPCGSGSITTFGDGQEEVEYVEPVNDIPF
jgi:hypothetical protein